MLYWKAETRDHTTGERTPPLMHTVVARGIEDAFLMFLQGLGARSTDVGLWEYRTRSHGVRVTLITAREYMAHRNLEVRLLRGIEEQDVSPEYARFLWRREQPAEILDTTRDPLDIWREGEVLHLRK